MRQEKKNCGDREAIGLFDEAYSILIFLIFLDFWIDCTQ